MKWLTDLITSNLGYFALGITAVKSNTFLDFQWDLVGILRDRSLILQYYQQHSPVDFMQKFKELLGRMQKCDEADRESITKELTYVMLLDSSFSKVFQIINENFDSIFSFYEEVGVQYLELSSDGAVCFLKLLNAKYCSDSDIFEEDLIARYADKLTVDDMLVLSLFTAATGKIYNPLDVIGIESSILPEYSWVLRLYYDEVLQFLYDNVLLIQDEALGILISNAIFSVRSEVTPTRLKIATDTIEACNKYDLYLIDAEDMLRYLQKRSEDYEKISG